MSYLPYGQERTSTADGREKFGTYFRDGQGQDYADQRYYNQQGDSGVQTRAGIWNANPSNPSTWNRTRTWMGDPMNRTDVRGLCSDQDTPPCYSATGTGQDPGDGGGGGGDNGGMGTVNGNEGGGGGAGPAEDPSIASAGDAKQGMINAFNSLSNCAKVMGGTQTVDAYVNQMTFLDGRGSGI